MTPMDGNLVHIVVPSKAPICPRWDVDAVADEAPTDNLTADARNSVRDSPTIGARAANGDGGWPESRTTIA
jgi:hypothetical protein